MATLQIQEVLLRLEKDRGLSCRVVIKIAGQCQHRKNCVKRSQGFLRTAIHAAAGGGHVVCLSYLLGLAGADIEALDDVRVLLAIPLDLVSFLALREFRRSN